MVDNSRVQALLCFFAVAVAFVPVYSRATVPCSLTGWMQNARIYHTATLLNSGAVLVTGGNTAGAQLMNTAEIDNPQTGPGGIQKSVNRLL